LLERTTTERLTLVRDQAVALKSFSFRVVKDQCLIGSGVASVRRRLPPSDLSEGSAELFRSHDVCHVIFGLDTTFADEALVDARTLLSCDAGVRKYARYLALSDDQPGSQSDFQRGRVSKIHLDNDSRHPPSSSGNLGGLEDAEEMALSTCRRAQAV
jgi:hypothetical protein